MVEREAALLQETQRWRLEANTLSQGLSQVRQAQRKNVLLAVLISTLGGLALGVGGTLIIGGR
jgi:amino acid transporter